MLDIFDKASPTAIASLYLKTKKSFPLPKALAVTTVTVDEDYRKQGIAKAAYELILKLITNYK